MGRKVQVDPQPSLVPLTEKELEAAKLELPSLLEQFDELEAEHKKQASANAKERKKLRGTIKSLASQIRQQGR